MRVIMALVIMTLASCGSGTPGTADDEDVSEFVRALSKTWITDCHSIQNQFQRRIWQFNRDNSYRKRSYVYSDAQCQIGQIRQRSANEQGQFFIGKETTASTGESVREIDLWPEHNAQAYYGVYKLELDSLYLSGKTTVLSGTRPEYRSGTLSGIVYHRQNQVNSIDENRILTPEEELPAIVGDWMLNCIEISPGLYNHQIYRYNADLTFSTEAYAYSDPQCTQNKTPIVERTQTGIFQLGQMIEYSDDFLVREINMTANGKPTFYSIYGRIGNTMRVGADGSINTPGNDPEHRVSVLWQEEFKRI